VFRAGRFKQVAGPALLVFTVQNVVVVLFKSLNIVFLILCCNLTRTNSARFVVNIKANSGQDICNVDMDYSKVLTRHVFHDAFNLVKCKAPHCDYKVEDLNERMVGFHQIVLY
jgi:hypothetical protein